MDTRNYENLTNTYKHLNGVQMDDVYKKSQLPVHLILGAGDYILIKTADKPVGNIGGPVTEKTKLNWTILARGNGFDYTTMLVTQTSQLSDYEKLSFRRSWSGR